MSSSNPYLTERQKELVRWLVNEVQAGRLSESFSLTDAPGFADIHGVIGSGGVDEQQLRDKLERGAVEALREGNFLLVSMRKETAGTLTVHYRDFVLTGLAYEAIRTDFKNGAAASPAAVTGPTPCTCWSRSHCCLSTASAAIWAAINSSSSSIWVWSSWSKR